MPAVTSVGVLSYAGFSFDAASKVKVSVEYVRDEANRTIIYQRHSITVQATVAPGDGPADNSLMNIRRRLGEPGQLFVFQSRGFGTDLRVGPGATEDVKFGPMPEVLQWEPVVSNRAAEIEWRIVVCIPYCGNGQSRPGGLMALNYDVQIDIDANGDTTRTISGYLEIGQSRTGRGVRNSADSYFNRLLVAPLDGFKRTTTRHLSKDKSRLDFTITDAQIPSRNPFPPNVTDIKAKHRSSWRRGHGGASFRNTISVDITPAITSSPAVAWQIFIDLVKKRIKAAKDAGRGVLIDDIDAEEDIFGRDCSFRCSYRVFSCLPDFLTHTGLFQPIGTDWNRWRTSINAVNGYYGTAGLLAGTDLIIDLCGPDAQQTIASSSATPSPASAAGASSPTANAAIAAAAGIATAGVYQTAMGLSNTEKPTDPNYTWDHFGQSLEFVREVPLVRQAVLQEPEAAEQAQVLSATTGPNYPTHRGVVDVLQRGGLPRYFLRYVGSARRAWYPIPRPRITATDAASETGQGESALRVEEVTGRFATGITQNLLGAPIYAAAWEIFYALNRSPEKVKQAPNPKACVDANGSAHAPGQQQ